MPGINQQGSSAPSLSEWRRVWQLWDAATLDMIPGDDITAQPLQLRHPFIFYFGHLPAFTDARLARVLQQQLTEPAHFAVMFARGIDPDLEDPTKCHSYSPIPPQWPELSAILQYRDNVRARITALYNLRGGHDSSNGCNGTVTAAVNGDVAGDLSAVAAMPADVQHVLWMCYEHEAMHLETFMYMLVQYDKVKPPPAHLLQHPSSIAATAAALVSTAHSNGAVNGATYQQQKGLHNASLHQVSSMVTSMAKLAVGSKDSNGMDRDLDTLLPLPAAATWVSLPCQHVTFGFNASYKPGDIASSQIQLSDPPANGVAAARTANGETMHGSAPAAATGLCKFGWDNESPARTTGVQSCQMQHRPVCVLEYLWFLAHEICKQMQYLPAGEQQCQLYANGCSRDAEPLLANGHSSNGIADKAYSTGEHEQLGPLAAEVAVLLGADGALQHLVPLSFNIAATEFAAAADILDVASNGRTGGKRTGFEQPETVVTKEAFNLLQQLVAVKTVFGAVPVSVAAYWPVYCSALQGKAYAAWWDGIDSSAGSAANSSSSSSSRLPTEGELLLARQHTRNAAAVGAPNGVAAMKINTAGAADSPCRSVDFGVWHPCDVHLEPELVAPAAPAVEDVGKHQQEHDNRQYLITQLQDNGWEWSSTMLSEHPGFKAHPLYPEYSTDFFDNKHHVLLGASWATVGSIAERETFRNFYQAGQQHVFAKFRLCRSI